jgi:hypothetical protein
MPLQCVECGAESDQGYLWRAFIADDEDEPPEVPQLLPGVCGAGVWAEERFFADRTPSHSSAARLSRTQAAHVNELPYKMSR